MAYRNAISIFKVRIEKTHEKLRIGCLRVWIGTGESALVLG
jgi:hypothetical protein